MNSYYTSVKPQQNEQKRNNFGNQQYRINRSKDNPRNKHHGNQNDTQALSKGGPSTPRYCIFCETNTHDTGFCKISKYTADFKSKQCQKHNACYMCFKTSEHKENTCPKIMKCLMIIIIIRKRNKRNNDYKPIPHLLYTSHKLKK